MIPGKQRTIGPLVDSESNLQDKDSVSDLKYGALSPDILSPLNVQTDHKRGTIKL